MPWHHARRSRACSSSPFNYPIGEGTLRWTMHAHGALHICNAPERSCFQGTHRPSHARPAARSGLQGGTWTTCRAGTGGPPGTREASGTNPTPAALAWGLPSYPPLMQAGPGVYCRSMLTPTTPFATHATWPNPPSTFEFFQYSSPWPQQDQQFIDQTPSPIHPIRRGHGFWNGLDNR